jgi:hypothetical protein
MAFFLEVLDQNPLTELEEQPGVCPTLVPSRPIGDTLRSELLAVQVIDAYIPFVYTFL